MHAPPGRTKPNPIVDSIRELKWTCPAEPVGVIGRATRLSGSGAAPEHVTVLSAPVGAGKTTFAADRARSFPGGAGWCVLDADDSDPHEFGISVLEAVLRVRSPGDLVAGAGTVGSRSDPLDEALRLAALGSPLMLVLDNCEALDPRSMHATLGRLVRRVPEPVPLVLVASQDVELPVRLRGATRLLELRAADLAFTVDDVRQLFAAVGVAMPEPDVAMLTQWTEGLASTVKLAVTAYRDTADRDEFLAAAASSRRSPHIFLTSCVLDGLPKELRTFLAEISIVERMSADLAAAITGADDADEKLCDLARAGLFIDALPSLPGWYQHRHPMRELIHAELLHEDPLGAMAAETRASIWFESIGDSDGALEHAASGDDRALLTRLVRDRWIAAATSDQPANMASMLTHAAPGSFDDLTACAIELDAGDSVAARARLAALDLNRTRSRARDARALRALIDLRLARESAVAADIAAAAGAVTGLVSQAKALATNEPSLRALAARSVADAQLGEGDLETAARMLEAVADDAALNGCRRHLANATASLALISALSGRIPQALALINADAGTWSTGSAAAGGVHSLAVAACAYHADTLPVAEAAITEARRELSPGVYRDAVLPVVRGRIAASIGDRESARRLVAGVQRTHPNLLDVLRDAFGLDAPARAASTHPHALALGRLSRAVTSYESQDPDQAFFELECTLELVLRHGFRRLLADSEFSVRPVLHGYVRRARPFGQLAGQLLARLPGEQAHAAVPLVETLTERELVVLRYLPSMMLNREIAAEMFFSENTVKTHLKSIYRKFGVTRRRDAVARARELSIL